MADIKAGICQEKFLNFLIFKYEGFGIAQLRTANLASVNTQSTQELPSPHPLAQPLP
jgi:hypothetical protein